MAMSAPSIPRMASSTSGIPIGHWTGLVLKDSKGKTRHQLKVSMEVSDWVALLLTMITQAEVWQVGVHFIRNYMKRLGKSIMLLYKRYIRSRHKTNTIKYNKQHKEQCKNTTTRHKTNVWINN